MIELLTMLTRLEWSAIDDEDCRYCTVCNNDKSEGHALGCAFGAMLRRFAGLHKAKDCPTGDGKCFAEVYHIQEGTMEPSSLPGPHEHGQACQVTE